MFLQDDSSSKYNAAPNNYLPLSAVSVLFCPLIGLLAVILSYTVGRVNVSEHSQVYGLKNTTKEMETIRVSLAKRSR